MKQFQTNVMWDLTLTDIMCVNSGYAPAEFEGLVTHATKVSGTVPDAVAGKYALGASVHNIASGVWYRMTGSTASPAWTVWAV